MSQMTAMIQTKRHNFVAKIQKTRIYFNISRTSGIGLYIYFISSRAKYIQSALLAHTLNFIHGLTSSIIALARIIFRVFVIQNTAHGLQYRGGGVTFRSEER